MDSQANSSPRLLASLLLLLTVFVAVQVHGSNDSLGICLGDCGQNVIMCGIKCAISDLPNLLKCVEACGSNNFGCMGKCTGVHIQDPSLPPPPPLPMK